MAPEFPSSSEEEEKWLRDGGIAPRRVKQSIDRGVVTGIASIYPGMLEEMKGHTTESIKSKELAGAMVAISILYTLGQNGKEAVSEDFVNLPDVIGGAFIEKISWLSDLRIASGEETSISTIEQVRLKGEEVLRKLIESGFIEKVLIPGDDYSSPYGYKLGKVGEKAVELLYSGKTKKFVEFGSLFRKHFRDQE